MAKVKVELIKTYKCRKPGTTLELPATEAGALVNLGLAKAANQTAAKAIDKVTDQAQAVTE